MTKGPEPSSPESDSGAQDPRRQIAFTVLIVIVTALLLWTLYAVRGTLLIVYLSALFATGISPLVRMIERQRARVARDE